MTKVNEKRLKAVLTIVSAYVWFKLFFFILVNVVEKIDLSIAAINRLELVLLVIFVLFFAPVCVGIRQLLFYFICGEEK